MDALAAKIEHVAMQTIKSDGKRHIRDTNLTKEGSHMNCDDFEKEKTLKHEMAGKENNQ
jgi:hypothetical protein